MENKNIIIVGGFLMAIVAIYGIIGAIVRYKHARSKKEAIDVAKENLIITIAVEVFIILGIAIVLFISVL